jgi:hypothetical protein
MLLCVSDRYGHITTVLQRLNQASDRQSTRQTSAGSHVNGMQSWATDLRWFLNMHDA